MSLPLLHAGRTNPGLSASLDLRFALDKSLTAYRGPTPSFSRASTGSYFDGSGVLRYAALNQVLYSEDFGNAAWVKQNGTISTDQIIAPDGKTTADKFTENVANTYFNIYNSSAVSHSAGATMTASGYFKYGTRRYIQFILGPAVAGVSVVVDLLNGLITATGSSGAASYTSSSITNVGNGWYRVSVTGTLPTANTGYYDLFTSNTSSFVNPYPTFSSSGEYTYIWGAQVETGSTVGTYCPTTSSANSAPRFNHAFNGTSWVSRGLLVEEQRTNGGLYSEDFTNAYWSKYSCSVSGNQATAPDGASTADKLIEDTSANEKVTYISAFNIAGPVTQSCFMKAGERSVGVLQLYEGTGAFRRFTVLYDLSNGTIATTRSVNGGTGTYGIDNVGNGWYRCWVSWTVTLSNGTPHVGLSNSASPSTWSASGFPQYTGNGTSGIYIWGSQVETGAFPTSYIGTTSSSVTRSADVCQITGSDFSGFWNGTEGAIAYEADSFSNSQDNQVVFQASDGTLNNQYQSARSQNNAYTDIGFWVKTGNVWQSLIATSSGAWNQNLPNKNAMAYKINDFAFSNSGATVLTDTSGTLPTVDRINIGASVTSAGSLNGHIARLRYFNKRLPNATLQLLSDPDPTLNLQFALNKTLTPVAGPAPSFSRASTGSYFDSTGTMKYANVNLLTYSEQFDNAAWTDKAGSTLYTNAAASPNGDLSADQLQLSNSGYYYQKKAYTTTGTHTFSVWLRSSSPTTTLLRLSNDAGTENSVVTCNVTTSWQRFSVTRNWSANPINFYAGLDQRTVVGGPGTSTNVFIWGAQLETGSSPSQYAKTEASTTAGPRFDHVYSGGQWVSRGLLVEEQRTNSARHSEDLTNAYWTKYFTTISSNFATAPDGNQTADKIIENTSNNQHSIFDSGFSVTAGTAYTISFFAKSAGRNFIQYVVADALAGTGAGGRVNFNLSNGTIGQTIGSNLTAEITDVGNGWYRCTSKISSAVSNGTGFLQFAIVPSATSGPGESYIGDGSSGVLLWGIQLESGNSFATSYIPVTSSSVTRSADVCQITGTSFNWMWNQGEGSVVAEYDLIGMADGAFGMTWQADDNTLSNRIVQIGYEKSGVSVVYQPGIFVANGGIIQASMYGPTISTNTFVRPAFAWKSNDFALSINGASVLTDTSGSIPTTNQINIGRRISDGYLNGHISKLIYYPARLLDAKLQKLST